jgi:hypothetical protein
LRPIGGRSFWGSIIRQPPSCPANAACLAQTAETRLQGRESSCGGLFPIFLQNNRPMEMEDQWSLPTRHVWVSRLWRVRGSGMMIVKKHCEVISQQRIVGDGGLKEFFLHIARQVRPKRKRGAAQQ